MQEEGLPSLQGGAWLWERSRWKARPASLVFLVFLVAVEALLDFLTDKVLPTFGKFLQLAGGVLQFLAGTIQFGRLEEETEFEVFADDLVKIPFDIFPVVLLLFVMKGISEPVCSEFGLAHSKIGPGGLVAEFLASKVKGSDKTVCFPPEFVHALFVLFLLGLV